MSADRSGLTFERSPRARAQRAGLARLAAAVLAATVVLGAGLSAFPLLEPDEGRYADVSLEFLATGDWIVPHLNGTSFHDKPPLVTWLTALCFAAFGEGRAVARLVPCIAGIGGVVVAAWLAHVVTGRLRAAWLAALILGVAPLWVALSRVLSLDVPLATLTIAGWALVVRGAGALGPAPRAPLRWLGGALLGLATLVKGPVALVLAGGAIGLTALIERDRALAWRLLSPGPWVVAACVAAPWFSAFARRQPSGAEAFVLQQNVARFLAWDEHGGGPQFYLVALAWGLLPTTFLLLALATRPSLATWKARLTRWLSTPPPVEGRGVRCIAAFSAVVVLFFTIASSKIETYVLPAMPALAALTGVLLDRRIGDRTSAPRLRVALLVLLGLVLALPLGWAVFALVAPSSGQERLRLVASVAWWSVGLAFFPMPAAIAAALRARSNRLAPALGLGLVAFGLTGASALPAMDASGRLNSAEAVGLAVRAARRDGQPILSFGVYLRGLPFFVGEAVIVSLTQSEMRNAAIQRERPDLLLQDVDDVARFLARREPVLVVTHGAWRIDLLRRTAGQVGARFEDGTLRHLGRFGGQHLFEVWPRGRAEPPS